MMKNFTSILALGLLAAALPAAAQVDFTQVEGPFYRTHRTNSVAADFTGNGYLDLFYGGQLDSYLGKAGWEWQMQSNLFKNNGDGTWTKDAPDYEFVEYQEENPETGQMEDKTRYDRVWPEHGVIGASHAQYAALDYNNDGLVDLLVFGHHEWDVFDYGNLLTDEQKQGYLFLYKNLGEGKFELVPEATFPVMRPHAGDDNNGGSYSHAIAVGDYDRDGYVDICVTGYYPVKENDTDPGRAILLYRNINGTGAFQDMKIAETRGGVWTKEIKDEDTGDVIVPKQELTGHFLTMKGNVIFADVNNDGWLDIVAVGQAENNCDEIHIYDAGNTGKVYLNQNGEKFIDATPTSPAFYTLRNGAADLADFDGDGYLDLFMTGWGDYGYNWNAFIFPNTADETFENIYDEPMQCAELGLDGTENTQHIITDFDGDGILDVCFANEKLYLGNIMGSFTHLQEDVIWHNRNNEAGIGIDIDNNGFADIFRHGYVWSDYDLNGEGNPGTWTTYVGLYKNNCEEEAEVPAAPENVTAEIDGDKLVITWEGEEDPTTAYNLFVKYADGSIYTLLPADPETGFVKVGYNRISALRPNITEYTLPAPTGDVTVGVQTISTYNTTFSPFTTATTAGINSVAADKAIAGDDVYYNLQGIRVANPTQGNIYIKVSNGTATKVAK